MKSKLIVLILTPIFVGSYFLAEWILARPDAARVVHREQDGDRHAVTVLSKTFELDKIYMSMQGPFGNHGGITLLDSKVDELLWITGIAAEVVDRNGETGVSPEFFCHANLTLSGDGPDAHNQLFEDKTHLDWRLFTLVPGRLDITLPDGFGIPARSSESFDYLAMSLNMNVPDSTVHVRFRTRIDFQTDRAEREMKPLFRRAVYGYEPLAGTLDPVLCREGAHPGEGCGPFLGVAASDIGFVESLGKQKTIHWMVPPGEYESRTNLADQLDLPFDTTIHYVTAHLHPYGTSITLLDVTAGETLFEIRSTDFTDRVGVLKMEEIALPRGVPIHTDHEYELVTAYNNPTDKSVDAMSILYLYLLDKEFAGTSPPLAKNQ